MGGKEGHIWPDGISCAVGNQEMAKVTLENGLMLQPSRTYAALWLLYHAVDEGVRSGEVDENEEIVTREVYHHRGMKECT